MTDRVHRLRTVCAEAAERIVLTGHDHADVDSVISCLLMRRLLGAWGMDAAIALPGGSDRQSARVLAGVGIDTAPLAGEIASDDCLILLDHHQPLHDGRVIACIDHHPTETLPQYPYVQIEPRGACALQVFDLMREAGIPMDAQDERLAVTALWLDTVALRSAKISKEEAAWGRGRAQALGLNINMLEREGLGLADLTRPPEWLAMQNKKTFVFSGSRVCSTTIQAHGMTQAQLDRILDVLRRAAAQEGAALWVYLVSDPIAMRSVRYDIAPDGCIKRIPYEFLASRGKNVMPDVEQSMKNRQEEDDGRL